MCGIVGYQNDKTTVSDLEILKRVMIESCIRGKHASGVAWYNGTKLCSFIQAIPIDQLVSELEFNNLLYNDSCISMVAHARYSTSDIRYNQPLLSDKLAIVHNGVITQEDPESWYDTYGYKCDTKNDSELILRAMENNDDPVKKFKDSSMAVAVLDSVGRLYYLRNGIRPLWSGKIGNGIVIASTFDILYKAGVTDINKVAPQGKEQQIRTLKTSEVIRK